MFLLGCDYAVLWEDSPYEVHWIDIKDNRSLAYSLGDGASIGRVDELIIAVGSNKKYIVAKQRELSTNNIFFYYIERERDKSSYNASDITQGPFSEGEFLEKKKHLNLPEFSKKFTN